MSSFTWPRYRFVILLVALLPLAACVCSDEWDDDRGLSHPRHDRSKPWPPPTPANPDLPQPAHDAGAAQPSDARVDKGSADTGGGSTNMSPSGSPDAGPPALADAGAADSRGCPAHGCAPAPVCQFDNQCGAEARCRNGLCERGCAATLDCGTGQLCAGGFCVPSEAPGGQCVYDRDCGTPATCINGFCHAHCTADSMCSPTRNRCLAGICRPDVGPRPQCRASSECPGALECINAVCRTPCATDVECCEGSSGSFCRAGVCVTAHEAAPECQLRDECGAEASCIDGVCATP